MRWRVAMEEGCIRRARPSKQRPCPQIRKPMWSKGRKRPIPPSPEPGMGEPGSIKRRRRGARHGVTSCAQCGLPVKSRRGVLECRLGCYPVVT